MYIDTGQCPVVALEDHWDRRADELKGGLKAES